jgi:hypothetical protein
LNGLVLRRELTLKIGDEIKMAGGLTRQGCGLCCWSWRSLDTHHYDHNDACERPGPCCILVRLLKAFFSRPTFEEAI